MRKGYGNREVEGLNCQIRQAVMARRACLSLERFLEVFSEYSGMVKLLVKQFRAIRFISCLLPQTTRTMDVRS